ncbi:hypothetical protein Lal_00038418 [Lupinus albus]|nr:hypothetical protein Lal_00038418 [Lupinus albus]
MRADSARHKKAKRDKLIAADEVSVNMLSAPSLILFVKGIAEDADDIKRYAISCNQKHCQSTSNSCK